MQGKSRNWLMMASGALAFAAFSPTAMAAGAGAAQAGQSVPWIWWLCPISSVVALVFAWRFYHDMLNSDPGDEKMIEIAEHVKAGAMAYLKQQYKVVTIFFICAVILLCIVAFGFKAQSGWVPFAFLTGGFFSGLAGFLGMKTATHASNRTTAAAKHSLNRSLQVAFRSGAVMGLVVVGLGLLDISIWFFILWFIIGLPLHDVTVIMLCFGFGASTQALFARVGGGIYTKAADVGADLVGKVEAGIPEDDPRNPATIADNVGDNVGDVAGMGADLYESYCGSVLASAALGVAALSSVAPNDPQLAMKAAVLPMVIAAVGILFSVLGCFAVKTEEGASQKKLLKALGNGILLASLLVLVFSFILSRGLLGPQYGWGIGFAIVAGLVAGLVIGISILYYTSADFKPTQEIAKQAATGPATVIIAGIAEGMFSTAIPVLAVIVGTMVAFGVAGGFESTALGLYGVGVAAVGMLSTLGITLATDAYGPIADNAGGNAEMSGQEHYVRERTDALDALGNTTAATGKGFAIGSAALTALALLAAYMEEVRVGIERMGVSYAKKNQAAIVAQLNAPAKSSKSAAAPAIKTTATDPAGIAKEVATQVATRVATEVATKVATKIAGQAAAKVPPVEIQGKPNARYLGDGYFAVFSKTKKGELKTEVYLDKFGVVRDDFGERKGGLKKGQALGDKNLAGYIQGRQLVAVRQATMGDFMSFYQVHLMNPKVLCGMFFGAMLAFVFCSMTMKAVGRAAGAMVEEVRRQFREIPGIMEGTGQPDYAACVAISTKGAQREMVLPSLMALAAPVIVGVVFGVPGVLGLLAGGLVCGFALAIMMANAGGAWDNAKKSIENEEVTYAPDDVEKKRPLTGKGSERHMAGVVGDTVGDPFKDTSGPSLNILIKLMSMVSVVFAGFVVKMAPVIGQWLGLQ